MGFGGITNLFNPYFDFGTPIIQSKTMYFTRTPQPTNLLGNIARPFPTDVWLMFALCLLVVASALHMCNTVYNLTHLAEYQLGKKGVPSLNFYLFAFTKVTEPEIGPWFKRWSTGRFVTLMWSVNALFLILFYTSNLRAHMVTVDYEDPPKSLEDIAATGNKVYIYKSALMAR